MIARINTPRKIKKTTRHENNKQRAEICTNTADIVVASEDLAKTTANRYVNSYRQYNDTNKLDINTVPNTSTLGTPYTKCSKFNLTYRGKIILLNNFQFKHN